MTLSKNIHKILYVSSTAMALLAVSMTAYASEKLPMADSVAVFSPDVKVLGDASPQSVIHFQVALRLRDYEGLAKSNAAGKILSAKELADKYLPTQTHYDTVLNWLVKQGMKIDATSSSRMTISASATTAEITRAMSVHFSKIQSEGKEFSAADSPPAVPSEIANLIKGINGLQPHLHMHSMMAKPHGSTTVPYYPIAFINAYGANGLGNLGANTTTAIVIDTFPLKSDLTQFWTTVGSPQVLGNISFIQTVPGTLAPPSGEESIDVETSSAVAPSSKVRVYASLDLSFTNLDTAYQAVITDLQNGVKITQVSISLGLCESQTPSNEIGTEDGFYAVMSSLGASVFISSGDSGSRECGGRTNTTSFAATSPNVTAVGGTTLRVTSSGTISSETGWSGSGGGLSSLFNRPSYQPTSLGFTKRAIPDFSAEADPNTGAYILVNGTATQYGGTSLAAPIVAGLMARVNSARLAAGKLPLGLMNSRIYSLIGTANFRDITSGSNGGYSAVVGYDRVTGIGTPKLGTLLPTLVAQP